MISDRQLEANRQNALQSTGPTTVDGVDAIKLNALRHGLRSVQTLVPGEDPDAWEAHRAAGVEDVKPVGVLELALAEQIAIKATCAGLIRFLKALLIGWNNRHISDRCNNESGLAWRVMKEEREMVNCAFDRTNLMGCSCSEYASE